MADITCLVSEIFLIVYLCSPVGTSDVHNFTCLYNPALNMQNERRKYESSHYLVVASLQGFRFFRRLNQYSSRCWC